MLGHFCLAELDLRSNLLNKIQFAFEVVPCLILGPFRRFFQRCASVLAQCYKGLHRMRGGVGGEGGGKTIPGEDTRSQLAHIWP